jgi:hypothetical protein
MKHFKSFSRTKKIIAVGAAAALTLGIAGTAFAYFTSTGSGTGTAYVGSTAPWTVAVSLDAGSAGVYLYPGVGTENLDFTITNSSGGPQALTAVNAAVVTDGSGLAETGNPASYITGCYASWFNASFSGALYLNGVTPYTYGQAVPSGQYVWGQVAVSMTESGTDQSACEGSTPNITVNAK